MFSPDDADADDDDDDDRVEVDSSTRRSGKRG